MTTVQITIIGLGQIGTSIGLALAGETDKVHRVGHDRDIKIARQAEKMGALDRVDINLPKAVREADLVLLALPVDQIRETMEIIASDLKEGVVVMDTGPIKEIVSTWAKELIPERRHYIGLTPVINPQYLHGVDSGTEAAREDLFQGGLMAIVAPPGADAGALKMAADLTRLLGAAPLFADPLEVDGLMAATHLLPELAAAALLNATIDQPGWREGRKFAGRAYAEATGPLTHLGDANSLKTMALLNRQNVLRVIDSFIASLQAIRADIESQSDATLDERLSRARRGREKWWKERLAGDWTGDGKPEMEIPETPGIIGRLLGTAWKPKKRSK